MQIIGLDKIINFDKIKQQLPCTIAHDWGSWETTARADLHRDRKLVGRTLFQERTCKRCRKVDMHVALAHV